MIDKIRGGMLPPPGETTPETVPENRRTADATDYAGRLHRTFDRNRLNNDFSEKKDVIPRVLQCRKPAVETPLLESQPRQRSAAHDAVLRHRIRTKTEQGRHPRHGRFSYERTETGRPRRQIALQRCEDEPVQLSRRSGFGDLVANRFERRRAFRGRTVAENARNDHRKGHCQ